VGILFSIKNLKVFNLSLQIFIDSELETTIIVPISLNFFLLWDNIKSSVSIVGMINLIFSFLQILNKVLI
jgi:hypothetical protein